MDVKRARVKDREHKLLMENMEHAQFLILKRRLKKTMNSITHPNKGVPAFEREKSTVTFGS